MELARRAILEEMQAGSMLNAARREEYLRTTLRGQVLNLSTCYSSTSRTA
jgi:hypothetical protein